jgi:hypothetical protein
MAPRRPGLDARDRRGVLIGRRMDGGGRWGCSAGSCGGLQRIAHALRFRYRAQAAGDAAAVSALDGVFETWFTEATGLAMYPPRTWG